MRNSRIVCALAVALCLMVCVYANTEVSKEDEAKTAVKDAQDAVKAVCGRAESQLERVNGLLQRVESYKNKAAQSSSHADEVARDNTAAAAIAQTIQSLSDEVTTLYSDEKGKLTTAVSTLTELLKEAKGLESESDITIVAKGEALDDYTETNTKATALRDKATNVDRKITTAVTPLAGVGDKADEMEKKAKKAQLKESHVSAIVSVATIETMLGNADDIIKQIEGKKSEVSGIVEQMQTLQRNASVVPDANIQALHTNANNALTAATGALNNANIAKAEIQTQKDLADAELKKIKAENQEVSDAQRYANTAAECVTAADKIFSKLNSKLQIADNSVTSAKDSKERLQIALSTATSATRTEQSVTQAKVKALKESVSADVQKIQTMVEEAESSLRETVNHKKAVNDIVQEMKALSTTEFIESNQIVKVLYKSADDALADATEAVKNAEKANAGMTEQKRLADAALTNVATATEVNTAQKEVDTTTECVKQVQQIAAKLKSALKTAKDSVTNAKALKQKLITALSTTTTAPSTVQATETAKTNPLVGQGTEPEQKNATVQPTSKDSPDQSTKSADKLKDTLSNGAQNVSTTALTGGKAPAPGANNDSAMTVSVPLLVALIASAVLQ